MTFKTVEWEKLHEPLGEAVCAIGVFDGVHVGHQQLIRRAVDLARERGVEAFVVTFDRDPDRVVTPDSAAPQLLTLKEKLAFLEQTGADGVLVIRFCRKIAELSPERFLEDVLLDAFDPVAVVVGQDFRFGRNASGTVDTLALLGKSKGFQVVPVPLLEVDGAPVTSTRIRSLIADGDVEEASKLLGKPHRIHGPVMHGRGEGESLGFATANVSPQPHAALPASGVYAGLVTAHEVVYPAAISVGRPPSFPEATDILEAHLIGFEGDLYHAELTVEFLERLRAQRAFTALDELTAAIASDVDTAAALGQAELDRRRAVIAARGAEDSEDEWNPNPLTGLATELFDLLTLGAKDSSTDYLEDGTPIVADPAVLEAAERAAAGQPDQDHYAEYDDSWVVILDNRRLGHLLSDPGTKAFTITAPLEDADIPFVWDPMPPNLIQNIRPDFNFQRRFSLLVPPERADEARALLGV